MAYTVLARKYRSQSFDDVVGQEPIARTLKNAIKTGRIAHAFLFVGTRGIGKTTMARVLAKALNCQAFNEPTPEPCCKCNSCLDINIGEDVDVVEIDGASNNGVDQVRELRQNAIYRPARSRYKIYIIDEVHMLTVNAFNALLKILEEPPAHVKFIFATTEPNKVIPTIQSRCQRYDFNNISPAAIAEHLKFVLKKEKIKYKDDLVLHLARMANGSMRDGLSLLDRLISTGVEPLSAELLEEYLGCPNSQKIHNLAEQIGQGDAAGTLQGIEDLINSGLSEVQIVDAMVEYMRNLMVIKSAGAGTNLVVLTEVQRGEIEKLAEKFDIAGLVYSITALEKLRWTVKNSDTAKALLEASLLRFALSEHFLNVDDLLGRLQGGVPPGGGQDVKKKLVTQTPSQGVVSSSVNTARGQSSNQSLKHAGGMQGEDGQVEQFEQTEQPGTSESKKYDLPPMVDIYSVKNNWENILKVIGKELGVGTLAVLSLAVPAGFENNVLTLEFEKSASKAICEGGGKKEKITSELSKCFGRAIRVNFELAAKVEKKEEKETVLPAGPVKSRRELKEEISNDPLVKDILAEFGASDISIDAGQ